jgi:hypothetical protein
MEEAYALYLIIEPAMRAVNPEENMIKFAISAGLAGVLALTMAAASPAPKAVEPDHAVHEGQGVVTALSTDASAITYWTGAADGWHVVTTVDTVVGQQNGEDKHAVVRFSSLLQPGQTQLISVPADTVEHQQVLRIRRVDGGLEVLRVPAPSA